MTLGPLYPVTLCTCISVMGMRKPCSPCLPIASIGSRSPDPLECSLKTAKTHGEEEIGLRKTRFVLLSVAEVYTEYLGLLLSEKFTEILLTHYTR